MKILPQFIVEVDADITEASVALSEWIIERDRVWFTGCVFSLMLCCLVYDDVSYSTDSFEELLSMTESLDEPGSANLFGAYLELQQIFFSQNKYDTDLHEALSDRIIQLQMGGPPILYEIFAVTWSRSGNYLLVDLGPEYAEYAR